MLDRFARAAQTYSAETVIRICADNPFIDPHELDKLVLFYESNDFDYVCNHQSRLGNGYADGFGAEIFSNKLLQCISSKAHENRHREHVTLYMWDYASHFRMHALDAPSELKFPELRFDIDTPDDLIRLSRLVSAGICLDSKAAEIIEIALATISE